MSLFGRKKKDQPEAVQSEPVVVKVVSNNAGPAYKWEKPEEGTKRVNLYVNLTEKNVKIEVADFGGTSVPGVYFWEEDGVIRGLKGDDVIFEVTKRSKAYKELAEYARTKTEFVHFEKKEGDYGTYYRMQVARRVPVEE